jgi:hypothetical protein
MSKAIDLQSRIIDSIGIDQFAQDADRNLSCEVGQVECYFCAPTSGRHATAVSP